MSLRVARRVRNPLPYQGKLTLSSGVITDVTRLAGVEGDGAAYPDSSVGVWPAATNLFSGKNRSSNSGANLVATLNSSEYPIFGGVSDKCVSAGSGTGEGVAIDQSADVSAATTYTWSVFGVFPAGSTLRLRATERDASDVNIGNVGTVNFVGTGALQRVTFTGATTTGVKARVVIETITTAQALTWYVAGWQLEAGSIATPFTTASRSAGSITAIPAGVLDETRMWVMARIRVDSTPIGSGRILSFADSQNERVEFIVANTNQRMYTIRQTGGAGAALTSGSGTIAVGDTAIYIGGVDANFVYAANNGAALSSAANTSIPTLSATEAAIGKQGWASFGYPGVSFKWLAIGLAAPTDALSALGYAWGNNDPLPHMFPPSARLSFLVHFNGDGTMYRYKA